MRAPALQRRPPAVAGLVLPLQLARGVLGAAAVMVAGQLPVLPVQVGLEARRPLQRSPRFPLAARPRRQLQPAAMLPMEVTVIHRRGHAASPPLGWHFPAAQAEMLRRPPLL